MKIIQSCVFVLQNGVSNFEIDITIIMSSQLFEMIPLLTQCLEGVHLTEEQLVELCTYTEKLNEFTKEELQHVEDFNYEMKSWRAMWSTNLENAGFTNIDAFIDHVCHHITNPPLVGQIMGSEEIHYSCTTREDNKYFSFRIQKTSELVWTFTGNVAKYDTPSDYMAPTATKLGPVFSTLEKGLMIPIKGPMWKVILGMTRKEDL